MTTAVSIHCMSSIYVWNGQDLVLLVAPKLDTCLTRDDGIGPLLAPAVTVGEMEGAMDSASILFLASAVTVGETEGAMDSASVLFFILRPTK